MAQQKAWLDGHPQTDPALAVPLRVLKVAEEAGLMVDWRPRDGDRPPLTQFVYDGGTLADEQIARIRLQEGEIAEYGFFDLDGARERLAPHTFERLTRALAVRDGREALQDLVEGIPRAGL